MEAIPQTEQIQIILEGRAFRVAQERLRVPSPGPADYAKLFTVSRRDIQAHVHANGLPTRAYFSRPGAADGNYLIEEDGRYTVYYQERGCRFDEFRYDDRKDAELVLVGMLLGPSGIGLGA